MMGFNGNNGNTQQNPQFNQNDPVFNMFGGFQNFQAQFNQFVGNMQQSMNPNSMASYAETQVRSNLQNGQIPQDKFNQAASIVNRMLGIDPNYRG
jgi:hypothetical protein